MTAIQNIPNWLTEWVPVWAIGPTFFSILFFGLWLAKRLLYVYLRKLNHPADYDTFVIFTGFDNSSINLTVMLRAEEYFNRFFIRSEFIKALHKRYAKEGIVIPYPIRAVNLSQEGSDKVMNK